VETACNGHGVIPETEQSNTESLNYSSYDGEKLVCASCRAENQVTLTVAQQSSVDFSKI